jgi:hypothetical protein
MRKRVVSTVLFSIVIALIAIVTAACSDGKKLKQEVQAALTKQQEAKNYRFSGKADMNFDAVWFTSGKNPLTAGLLSMVTQGKLTWSGTASTDPVQLEADIHLKPSGYEQSIELPMMIKDNKMYVHIPMINPADEYFVIDMDRLNTENSTNPLSPDSLRNAGEASTDIVSHLVESIHPKWFKLSKTSDNDKKLRSIIIEVNENNIQELAAGFYDKFPVIAEELKSKGLISAEAAGQIKLRVDANKKETLDKTLRSITANKPGFISFTINEQGFITEKQIDLTYSIETDTGAKTSTIRLYSSLDEINQKPSFTKPIPTNVKSFEDILNFLNRAAE